MMDSKKAREILEIHTNEITEIIVKKQYRIMALKYHPDKNRSINAVEEFQNIQSAYDYLMRELDTPYFKDDTDFDTILNLFLESVLDDEYLIIRKILTIIIPKVIKAIQLIDISKIRSLLKPIDTSILNKLGDFFIKYATIFEGCELNNLSKIINEFINTSEKKDTSIAYNHILLHPILEDLFQNNIYKLTEYGETLLIPLWFQELVYDISGSELLVECYPILPENISIDNNNDIYIELEYGLLEIWFMDTIEFSLGDKNFCISKESLKMVEKQEIILRREGISRMDENNIYSVREKGDIHVHITIHVG